MAKTVSNQSHKDNKYFIDDSVYNCPFCNRRHVKYYIKQYGSFDLFPTQKRWFYIAICADCKKNSLHLSKHIIRIKPAFEEKSISKEQESWKKMDQLSNLIEASKFQFVFPAEGEGKEQFPSELDDYFIHHLPTSFFTLDERIPKAIRNPLSEAENCLNNNYLTGASSCLRKAIYKLLKDQNIKDIDSITNEFIKYEDRINIFKNENPHIDKNSFDLLKVIHALTSQELHENDWKDLDSPNLHLLFTVVRDILHEIYVIPDDRKLKRDEITKMHCRANESGKNRHE